MVVHRFTGVNATASSPIFRQTALTLAVAALGGALFVLLQAPLPWLLGALVATAVAAQFPVRLGVDLRLRAGAHAVLGVMIGSAFTPELLSRAASWALSLSAIPLYLLIAVPVAIAFGKRVMKLDPVTATFANIPGGLSEMILSGSMLGGDLRALGVAHLTRLSLILVLVPFALEWATQASLSGMVGGPVSLPPRDAMLLALSAGVGAGLGKALRLPTPYLMGALLVSAAVHLAGLTEARPPGWLLAMVQVFIGALVGMQFRGAKKGETLRLVLGSGALTLVLLLLALVFAAVLTRLTGFGFLALSLAFVPGGIAEMALIALLLNVDPVFVAAHHTLRVALILPLARVLRARLVRRDADPG